MATCWRAILARVMRLMSSSVLPENIQPQITSIQPAVEAERITLLSTNMGV